MKYMIKLPKVQQFKLGVSSVRKEKYTVIFSQFGNRENFQRIVCKLFESNQEIQIPDDDKLSLKNV